MTVIRINAKRDEEIVRLRQVEGRTMKEIAAKYGLSGTRVAQIVNDSLHASTGHRPSEYKRGVLAALDWRRRNGDG
jgi:Mor family transcriptional regulator